MNSLLDLDALGLTKAQRAARDGKITASRVATLMHGDEAAILNLWRELAGDPDHQPEDLSGKFHVVLGSYTEALNLAWIARHHGLSLTRIGESVSLPDHPWAACTLDAWDDDAGAPVEAKHVNAYSKLPEVVERYRPQLAWQCIITGAETARLSVIIGTNAPVIETVPVDINYAAELWDRAEAFWRCVETLTPPVALPPAPEPPPPATRTVDMTGNNAFASDAADWLDNRAAAKAFDAAAKSLKTAMPEDAASAYGHGVTLTRARNRAITIKADAAERKDAA